MRRAVVAALIGLLALAAVAQEPGWRLAPFTPGQALAVARQLFQQFLAQERLYDWQFGEPVVSAEADTITVTIPFRAGPTGAWTLTFGRGGGIDEQVDLPTDARR